MTGPGHVGGGVGAPTALPARPALTPATPRAETPAAATTQTKTKAAEAGQAEMSAA